MATRYKDAYQDDKTLWELALVPFVAVISTGPGAGYVRGRVPQMQEAGEPLPVAVFQAMAEYVAQNPINPRRAMWSPCPICGRASRIYPGRGGWPDMARCERCDRTHALKDNDAAPQAVEATADAGEWWNL